MALYCKHCHLRRCRCKAPGNAGVYLCRDEISGSVESCAILSDEEKEEHHELCNDGYYFSVKPIKWEHVGAGRSGVQYAIVKCKTMAMSKDEDNANEIVRRLNLARKAERDNDRLRSELRVAKSAQGHSVESVRQAMIKEVCGLEHCRWSSHRKQIVAFGMSVMRRLGGSADIDCINR